MSDRLRLFVAIVYLLSVLGVACGEETARVVTDDSDSSSDDINETDDATDSGSDSHTTPDTATDPSVDTETDSHTDSQTDTETDSHIVIDSDTTADSETERDTDTNEPDDTETSMDTETETTTDTSFDTEIDTGIDTWTDTGTDTGSDTDTAEAFWMTGPLERTVVVNGVNVAGYVLEFTNGTDIWRFECTAQQGGLISAFLLNGRSIIHNSNANGAMYGSTFWTSPQSVWNWPPPSELNTANWTASTDPQGRFVEMTSPVISSLQLQVTKRFEADLTSGIVLLTYTITNTGGAVRSVAPWEITRVSPGGLTYYPTGQGAITSGSFSAMPYSQSLGVTWIDHAQVTGEHKLFADGAEGWLAHTDGVLLLLKSFDDISPSQAAPGEAEIEIYAKTTYEEVEQQGAYVPLAPGASLTFDVTWSLTAVPAAVSIAAGSQSLLDYTRSQTN